MSNFAQQGPRAPWQNHQLGHGGRPGTVGQYGCKVTTRADIATWAGYPTDPGQMNDLFNAHGIFTVDPSGTFDFLPDNALEQLWPNRFKLLAVGGGRRDDMIRAALPTKDQYISLGLAWTAGGVLHTHFVPVVGGSGPDWLIGDSWDGVTKHLSAYGINAVTSTVIEQALPKGPDPAVIAAQVAAAEAKAKADALAADAATAARQKAAADAAAAKATLDAAAQQAAQSAATAALVAAAAAAKAKADAQTAQVAHDKAVAAAAAQAALAGRPTASFQSALVAFLRWLIFTVGREGHGQAAINAVQRL